MKQNPRLPVARGVLPRRAHVPLVPKLSAAHHLGRILMKKALDFRGDNDIGWTRAVAYLIRDMKDHGT
ncbi:MAG: hypothetical protein ACREYE_06380 [Gammaproteobacteria bacterium]